MANLEQLDGLLAALGTHETWAFDPTEYGRAQFGYGLLAPEGVHCPTGVHISAGGDWVGDSCGYSDERARALGQWIAAIHNAAPEMMAEIRALRAQRDRLAALIKEVRAYNRGKGKYDFRRLPSYDRQNAADDAWRAIAGDLDAVLTEIEQGEEG